MNDTTMRIRIEGASASGKSTLLHEIGLFLMQRGYNAECYDGGRRKIRPMAIAVQADQRLIRLSTHRRK